MSWTALYAIDFFAILTFGISYYFRCYRRGYRIDFWHTQLFFTCIFPNMILLPFARNEMNAIVLRGSFYAVMDALPVAFLITLVGYIAFLIGGEFWRLQTGVGVRGVAKAVLEIVPKSSMMLMSSRTLLVFQSVLCLVLQAIILLTYFANSGFGFDLRDYTFAHPALRPVAQTISTYSVVLASHALARYIERKERILLVCVFLLSFGLLFFGARSSVAAIFTSILMCYFVQRREKLNLFWFSIVIFFVVSVAFYLGSLRSGEYSVIKFYGSLAFLLLYGNNFSDLRDFAWVYSAWDHQFWGGRTYLAALTSFVPRAASQFRDTWGLGAATDLTVGFDPQVHPGLRPGAFGEGYLNFGFLGVIVAGLLLGILVRRVDIDTKSALATLRPSMMRAYASTMLLQLAACVAISINLSGFYVLIGIYVFSWVCLQILTLTGVVHKEPMVRMNQSGFQ